MMTAFLLARAGIEVVVLEKHKDFLRDFRGDTIHPSTFELMYQLGLLEEFLQLPHQEAKQLGAQFNDRFLKIADFSHLPVAKAVLGFMPQWDFLNFLQKKAQAYPAFKLIVNARATDLLIENDIISGVLAETPEGLLRVQASLVIGADGRSSVVREKAGLEVVSSVAPIDVLWFRIRKSAGKENQSLGRLYHGRLMILIDREEYYQCGYVIAKGEYDALKERGLPAFIKELEIIAPFLGDAVYELQKWEDVSKLSVVVDHLKEWFTKGVLCIGDAAHAMSPVGGVGINLALQDAVATANMLYPVLKGGKDVDISILKKVQERRSFPARMIQRMQIVVHKAIIKQQRNAVKAASPPLVMRLLDRIPYLRRFPARLIGLGIRRENIETPEIKPAEV